MGLVAAADVDAGGLPHDDDAFILTGFFEESLVV